MPGAGAVSKNSNFGGGDHGVLPQLGPHATADHGQAACGSLLPVLFENFGSIIAFMYGNNDEDFLGCNRYDDKIMRKSHRDGRRLVICYFT